MNSLYVYVYIYIASVSSFAYLKSLRSGRSPHLDRCPRASGQTCSGVEISFSDQNSPPSPPPDDEYSRFCGGMLYMENIYQEGCGGFITFEVPITDFCLFGAALLGFHGFVSGSINTN